jgi:DNA polymerase III subunit gamma/tau
MFGGMRGCGKTSYARIIAKSILCSSLADGEPCNECSYCNSVELDNSMIFDEFDSASNGTVDKIRSIVKSLDYKISDNKPRILIFDEAQRLSASAQDALLKPVEERRFVCIFCTTEPNKIRGPIRSRLEEYQITPPSSLELADKLFEICRLESIEIDTEALDMIISYFQNIPRSCLNAIESLSTLGKITKSVVDSYFKIDKFNAIVNSLTDIDKNPAATMNIIDDLSSSEGPVWVRDTMVDAIVAAYRKHLNIKSGFIVSANFFHIRGMAWLDTARRLAMLDKPTSSSIISVIFSNYKMDIQKPSIESKNLQNKVIDEKHNPEIVADCSANQPVKDFIDVGGIRFHKNGEKLTSLDDKITNIDKPSIDNSIVFEFDPDSKNLPLSEKEFASILLSRLKSRVF